MTRELSDDEFASFAIITVLRNDMTLAVAMVSAAQINTRGRTNIWAQGVNMVSVKMHSTE
jgi:hypothetical protein